MKPEFVISCPIDTYSGYGARSRDLVKSIIELDKYDVKIMPQRWGALPWGFIDDHKEWHFLKSYFLNQPQLTKQPEIWMQISVPNEFQPVGKYNIGCTAGIETTMCHHSWIEGLNRMNINLVSSEHSKSVYMGAVFEHKNQQGQKIGDLRLTKPVEVLFEGVDITTYKQVKVEKPSVSLNKIKEDFCYLFMGHWMQGDFGEDRKNVGLVIKSFYETFKNKSKTPALILKTSQSGCSYMDRREILKRINQLRSSVNATKLPKIYLLHGDFNNNEINELYNHPKVKAMISLTKGEGFGRPLLEFSLTNKPIIAPRWSGQLDFLDKEFTSLINGEVKQIHPSSCVENILIPESGWFAPNPAEINYFYKDVFKNYKKYLNLAKRQGYKSRSNFSFSEMKSKIDKLLTSYIPEFPKEVKLKLPTFNQKETMLNLPKLNLPKLKPVENE